jgi:hypothetical protein
MFVKVFNNEKVGGLTVVSIDRPGFFKKICADPKLKLFRPLTKYPSRDTGPLIFCPQSKYRLEFSRSVKKCMIDRVAILTVFSVSGENILHRCFNSVYYVRTVLKPDIDAVFVNDFCIQIIETGFAEKFYNAGTSVEYFSPSNGIVKED